MARDEEGMCKPLKVVINAQLLPDGKGGGVEQFVTGLVRGLGQLVDGSEEYLIIGPWRDPFWLEPYLGPNQRLVPGPQPRPHSDPWEVPKRFLGPLRDPVGKIWRGARGLVPGPAKLAQPTVPVSEGFYESLDADVIHFPYQNFVYCNIPTIYNPHDLQHLHLPQFWTEEVISWRETTYRAGCLHAKAVAAESQWVKDDIIKQYEIDPNKIYVIRRGSPTEFYEPTTCETLVHVRQKFELPQTFALYPAQTWAHKNHLRLLEAIKLVRDQHDLCINLVCPGRRNHFWPNIEERIHDLKVNRQVFFLDFVTPSELRALYHLAQFLVFPSLFEGGGFPILEAFREGTPVACSAVTSLIEYGGDAVVFFDAASVESIGTALQRMSMDSDLRETLRQRGALRIRLSTWEMTAKTYRALYRKIAGSSLTNEERHLLALK